MCNLYSITTNQAAVANLFRRMNRYVGNLQPMPGVFPDYPAPVIRNTNAGSEMVLMRWGMPPPPRTGGPPVTNIRNTSSPHWRMWLKPENRCLVPANSFAEYAPVPKPADQEKGRGLVRAQPGPTAVRFRGHLDDIPRYQVQAGAGAASGLRLPDDITKRGDRADPSEGHAGDSDDR